MEATDDVHLTHRLRQRGDVLEDVVEAHRVAARVSLLRGEGAEVAGGHADVRVVDVRVPDEVGGVAVALLPHVVRERPERQQIVGRVERDAVLERQALARQHLVANGLKLRVAKSRLEEGRCHESLEVITRPGRAATAKPPRYPAR